MITTIKVVILIMTVLSVFGVIAEKDKDKQFNLSLVAITNVVAVTVLGAWA